jgi:hypothetical protein
MGLSAWSPHRIISHESVVVVVASIEPTSRHYNRSLDRSNGTAQDLNENEQGRRDAVSDDKGRYVDGPGLYRNLVVDKMWHRKSHRGLWHERQNAIDRDKRHHDHQH